MDLITLAHDTWGPDLLESEPGRWSKVQSPKFKRADRHIGLFVRYSLQRGSAPRGRASLWSETSSMGLNWRKRKGRSSLVTMPMGRSSITVIDADGAHVQVDAVLWVMHSWWVGGMFSASPRIESISCCRRLTCMLGVVFSNSRLNRVVICYLLFLHRPTELMRWVGSMRSGQSTVHSSCLLRKASKCPPRPLFLLLLLPILLLLLCLCLCLYLPS